MTIRLVDHGWDAEVRDGLAADRSDVRIISPFIKLPTARRFLEPHPPQTLRVITRFDLAAFARGVSDITALRRLLADGAQVRDLRRLHAKVYIMGGARSIVTSANLTESGLLGNHEYGVVADDDGFLKSCRSYFDRLWAATTTDLTEDMLDGWAARIRAVQLAGGRPSALDGLPDEGESAPDPSSEFDKPSAVPRTPWLQGAGQTFVKIFGLSTDRAPRTMSVLEEVQRSGANWAATYPATRRPREVADGDAIYMGRLVGRPDDILIFGRAVAFRHVPGRDDASPEEIADRPWKAQWPRYVRVHGPEFLAGTLAGGVSLNALMRELGSDAFASTQRNARAGVGNTNPRRSYGRKPSVRLSGEGAAWLGARLEAAFRRHGVMPPATLEALEWPPDVTG